MPEDLHLPDDDDDGHNPPPKGMDSADWDESKHPRDDDGKFSAGNSNGNNPEEKEKDKLAKQADCQNQLLTAINNLKENEDVGVSNLRDDLKQYGVTNDTVLKWGMIMLIQGCGIDLIIELDGYKAILSLNDNRKKKERLLTGYKIDPVYKSQKSTR